MILLYIFHTHRTDDLNDASTSFTLLFSLLLVFLRLLLHLVFCLDLRDEWTSGLLFFCCTEFFSRFTRRDFCSLILLLWLSVGLPVGFSAKRDLFEMILGKLKLAAARFETSTLITFYHWKFFRRCRGLNPGLHSQSCLWCIYCKAALMQTWKLDISSSRWGVKALSLEVPCQGSWCRCQTYPTWAPRGRLPS